MAGSSATEPLDSIIVGGGAAGLSAALVLGRARRSTLLIDAGQQSNLPDTGVGGLLGHKGRPPAELHATGRRDLEEFPTVEVRSGVVLSGTGTDEAFVLDLEDGSQEKARKLIFAMGMNYVTADLPGLKDLWGRSVFHCPFCHGWDVRDGSLAVRGNGATGIHAALMIRGWSDDIIMLTDGPADFDDEQRRTLDAAGIFAAGDLAGDLPQVSIAAAAGSFAGMIVIQGLLAEDLGLPLPPAMLKG